MTGAPGAPRLLFVVEQPGRARRPPRPARRHPFLDISGRVSFEGERGLLSVAFPPDYGASGSLYVYYTDNGGNIRVDEFHRAQRHPSGSRLAPRR